MKDSVKLAVINATVLILISLILMDYAERGSYALSAGWSPGALYLPLLRVTLLNGRGFSFASPPTLDWVQLLAVLLIAVDFFYLYRHMSIHNRQT